MDEEPRPTPQWETLNDTDTQDESSGGSDEEDLVDEIQRTSSPFPVAGLNVAKRTRDVAAGGSERPKKRLKQGVRQGALGSKRPGGTGFAPPTRLPNSTSMEAGPSTGRRIQYIAQGPASAGQRAGSATGPMRTGPSDSDSDGSVMVVDEGGPSSTSQPVPRNAAHNASTKTVVTANPETHIEISSSSSSEHDSSSSPPPPISRGVAKKSVRGPPPNVARDKAQFPKPQPPQHHKSKEPVKPRPSTSHAVKQPPALPQISKGSSTVKGKEPAKPPPPGAEIIELSSDEGEALSPPQRTPSSDKPRFQSARKSTGGKASALPRTKIKPRVSDAQPDKASLSSGSGSIGDGKKSSASGSGAGASTSTGGKGQTSGIGWEDFANMVGSAPKPNESAASATASHKSRNSSPTKSTGAPVTVKVAPNSPQKVPTGRLDGYVVNKGKRAPRHSAGTSAANDGVDMRPLPEALGISSKATAKAEKRKQVVELTQKVNALSSLSKKATLNDLAEAITQAGRSNAQGQSFATPKKTKPKPKVSLPPQAIDPTQGASVDAPIDLTLSDDDGDAPPARPISVPRRPKSQPEAPAPRPPPLPQRRPERRRLSGPGSQPVSAPVSAAVTPPPEVSRAAAPLPPPASTIVQPVPQPVPLGMSVTAPHILPEPPQSPTRRHTMPNPVASSSAVHQQSIVPAITRIANPVTGDTQRFSMPPASPTSVVSETPSRPPTPPREPSPIPVEPPARSLLTPPPLDVSRITNAGTVQSTPLAPQPIALPRASLPSLLPVEAPKDVPHNQAPLESLFTDDESDGDHHEYAPSIDRLFDDDDDSEPATGNFSDAEAAMEVDDLLAPQSRGVSSELDGVTEALGSQKLKNATPSEGSVPPSDALATSPYLPTTPAVTDDDAFEDFYGSEPDEPPQVENAPAKPVPTAPSSASASSRGSMPRTPEEAHDLPRVSPVTGKSYGGLAALTFDNWRDEYEIDVRYTKDLPQKQPHNHINNFSEHYQSSESMRQALKAIIADNTRLDEPEAPPIEILNRVDNDPVPPWEFYYTNHMYHGPGVPVPEGAKLKGCDCVGKCDPRSKTCQCVMRQREWLEDYVGPGFVYDKQRRLRQACEGYPIWECNDLCGCDDDCMNRVVQRGRTVQVSIQKTEKKGWGVFCGPKKIPRGTFLGVYAGEILTVPDSDKRGEVYEKWGRTYLFDIDFYHLERLELTTYTVDAYHVGNFTRFLNHSCDPNAQLFPCYINETELAKPLLVIFSTRDIEPHEEICFNYSGEPDEETARAEVPDRDNWKACHCEAPNCNGIMFT